MLPLLYIRIVTKHMPKRNKLLIFALFIHLLFILPQHTLNYSTAAFRQGLVIIGLSHLLIYGGEQKAKRF